MLIRTAREVGLLIRDQRRAARITQAELAERVGASREWIRLLESGKPRLELGLTLRALTALGITLDAQSSASVATPVELRPSHRRTLPLEGQHG
jgi:transcriptional regulator with XRE-family HTH domain